MKTAKILILLILVCGVAVGCSCTKKQAGQPAAEQPAVEESQAYADELADQFAAPADISGVDLSDSPLGAAELPEFDFDFGFDDAIDLPVAGEPSGSDFTLPEMAEVEAPPVPSLAEGLTFDFSGLTAGTADGSETSAGAAQAESDAAAQQAADEAAAQAAADAAAQAEADAAAQAEAEAAAQAAEEAAAAQQPDAATCAQFDSAPNCSYVPPANQDLCRQCKGE